MSLVGHTETIAALGFARSKVITGSLDRSIRIWDVASRKCVKVIDAGHKINCFYVTPGDTFLFAGTNSGEIRVYDLKTYTIAYLLKGHLSGVNCLTMANGYLYSGGQGDCIVYKWKAEKQLIEARLSGHTDAVTCMVSQNGLLYTGSHDGSIRVWHTKTNNCIRVLDDDSDVVTSMVIIGGYLLAARLQGMISQWSLKDGKHVRTFRTHGYGENKHSVWALQGHKNTLYVGEHDGSVSYYSILSGAWEGSFPAHTGCLTAMLFCGASLITAGSDNVARIWPEVPKARRRSIVSEPMVEGLLIPIESRSYRSFFSTGSSKGSFDEQSSSTIKEAYREQLDDVDRTQITEEGNTSCDEEQQQTENDVGTTACDDGDGEQTEQPPHHVISDDKPEDSPPMPRVVRPDSAIMMRSQRLAMHRSPPDSIISDATEDLRGRESHNLSPVDHTANTQSKRFRERLREGRSPFGSASSTVSAGSQKSWNSFLTNPAPVTAKQKGEWSKLGRQEIEDMLEATVNRNRQLELLAQEQQEELAVRSQKLRKSEDLIQKAISEKTLTQQQLRAVLGQISHVKAEVEDKVRSQISAVVTDVVILQSSIQEASSTRRRSLSPHLSAKLLAENSKKLEGKIGELRKDLRSVELLESTARSEVERMSIEMGALGIEKKRAEKELIVSQTEVQKQMSVNSQLQTQMLKLKEQLLKHALLAFHTTRT